MNLKLDMAFPLLEGYLKVKNWMNTDEHIQELEKPGEGNMNMVLRVITNQGSLILKQANPYVQKYPTIPAPIERVAVEANFYETIQPIQALRGYMPELLGFDPSTNVLAIEDLGEGADFTFIYQKGNELTIEQLNQAITFLSVLHRTPSDQKAFPNNLALRKLNHEHLFLFPFMENNGFDLDTVQVGLQAMAMTYKTDEQLKTTLQSLGERYLSAGKTLLHGDYYPGSWLQVESGFRVIDPEFCFVGPAAYDVGILLAHLKMAQANVAHVEQIKQKYEAPKNFDWRLAEQFTGMEIMRRIIGLAQLPLDLTLAEKDDLLKEAYQLIVQ